MNQEEKRLCDLAVAEARALKKTVCKKLTDPAVFPPEQHPVAVFMAGSPGAGKTESSLELVAEFEREPDGERIRVRRKDRRGSTAKAH